MKRDTGEYKRIPWMKEELTALKRYMAKGISCHQIALMLGRSHGSVENKIRQVRAKARKKEEKGLGISNRG
jgi:transposase